MSLGIRVPHKSLIINNCVKCNVSQTVTKSHGKSQILSSMKYCCSGNEYGTLITLPTVL